MTEPVSEKPADVRGLLPRFFQWNWVAALPSTNYRIFVTVILEVVYVLAVLIMLACGVDLSKQITVIAAVGTFITAWLGLDVRQFHIKRKTHSQPQKAAEPGGAP